MPCAVSIQEQALLYRTIVEEVVDRERERQTEKGREKESER